MLVIPQGSLFLRKSEQESLGLPVAKNTDSYATRASIALTILIACSLVGAVVAAVWPQSATAIFLSSWGAFVLAAAVFVAWLFRAYRNLGTLGIESLFYSPRWAVLGYVVPIVNAYVPKQMVDDLWRASFAGPKSTDGESRWPLIPAPSWIAAWWGSQVTFIYVLLPLWFVADGFVTAQIVAVSGCLALVVSGGFGLHLVRAITARQMAIFAELDVVDVKQRPAICPLCKAPLRTRRAKQCPSCLLDWHDFDKLKFLGGHKAIPRTGAAALRATNEASSNTARVVG